MRYCFLLVARLQILQLQICYFIFRSNFVLCFAPFPCRNYSEWFALQCTIPEWNRDICHIHKDKLFNHKYLDELTSVAHHVIFFTGKLTDWIILCTPCFWSHTILDKLYHEILYVHMPEYSEICIVHHVIFSNMGLCSLVIPD